MAVRDRRGLPGLKFVYFSPPAVLSCERSEVRAYFLQDNHFKIQALYRFEIQQTGSFSWQSLRTPGNKAGRIIDRFW
jgi:hypothetical protein